MEPPPGVCFGSTPVPAPALDIQDLHVVYKPRASASFLRHASGIPAVSGVSIVVEPGEAVGVVGESGSGKSSIARSVVGIGPISSGTIRVLGKDRTLVESGRRGREARADVQMVFQDPYSSLDPRQSIGSGFAELRALHPARTAWTSDEDLLGSVGLHANLLKRYPHQLSGGQCQRVSIARALLLRPVVLVADEPTSALDVSVQAQILNLLLDLQSDWGFGILFISHDLGVVRQTCKRVYVLQKGGVVESGTTETIFSSPTEPYTQRLISSIPGRGKTMESFAPTGAENVASFAR